MNGMVVKFCSYRLLCVSLAWHEIGLYSCHGIAIGLWILFGLVFVLEAFTVVMRMFRRKWWKSAIFIVLSSFDDPFVWLMPLVFVVLLLILPSPWLYLLVVAANIWRLCILWHVLFGTKMSWSSFVGPNVAWSLWPLLLAHHRCPHTTLSTSVHLFLKLVMPVRRLCFASRLLLKFQKPNNKPPRC